MNKIWHMPTQEYVDYIRMDKSGQESEYQFIYEAMNMTTCGRMLLDWDDGVFLDDSPHFIAVTSYGAGPDVKVLVDKVNCDVCVFQGMEKQRCESTI